MLNKRFSRLISILLVLLLLVGMTTLTACKPGKTSTSSTSSSISGDTSSETGSDRSSDEIASTSTGSDTSVDSTTSETGSSTSSSSKTKLTTSSRPVVSNAPTVPPKKDEVSIPSEVEIEIKPVKDHIIKETVKNMNGKTFTFATFWEQNYKASSATPIGDIGEKALKSIQTDYNCKINLIAMNQDTYLADINTAKAAGKIYANIFESHNLSTDLISSGILADLRTVNSVNLAGQDWNPAFILSATYKNGIYGVGVDQNRILRETIYFNKTIAAKYNLGNFYEMVKKKQWTFDKFLSISQDVYNKSDKKIYALNAYHQADFGNFAYANNTSPVVIKSGKVVFNDQDSKLLDSLNFVQNYTKLGLIDLNFFKQNIYHSGSWPQTVAFANGKSLFFLSFDTNHQWISPIMTDDFGILPFPIGPHDDNYKSILSDTDYFGLFNQDPDIEDAGVILTAISARTYIKISDWDKNTAKTLRDTDTIDMLHLIMNAELRIRAGGDPFEGGLKDYNKKAIPQIVRQLQTPRQALDAIANSVKVQIDSYYGN